MMMNEASHLSLFRDAEPWDRLQATLFFTVNCMKVGSYFAIVTTTTATTTTTRVFFVRHLAERLAILYGRHKKVKEKDVKKDARCSLSFLYALLYVCRCFRVWNLVWWAVNPPTIDFWIIIIMSWLTTGLAIFRSKTFLFALICSIYLIRSNSSSFFLRRIMI